MPCLNGGHRVDLQESYELISTEATLPDNAAQRAAFKRTRVHGHRHPTSPHGAMLLIGMTAGLMVKYKARSPNDSDRIPRG